MPSLTTWTLATLTLLGTVRTILTAEGKAPCDNAARPTTGQAVASLVPFDRLMHSLMDRYQIPGGSLAVAKDGRLVLARGYGWADEAGRRPVEPTSPFRVASLSKPITVAAILKLVEQGKLRLDEPAFARLGHLKPPEGARVDPRLKAITIAQLLHHTGGWDREASFDPMFIPRRAAEAVGAKPPADPKTVIRYMLGQKLDFDPGTKYAYSNFGYCVLGRIIEQVAGESYEQAVRRLVLEPAGAGGARLGRTRTKDRPGDEVRYYDFDRLARTRSVFPDESEKVARPDGGFYLEAMDAHGGWTATPSDLLRFVTALDGSRRPRLLKFATIATMLQRPAPPLDPKADHYYGLGWLVRPVGEKGKQAKTTQANWWHTGSLPGTATLLVRGHNGLSWAAMFNTRPRKADRLFGELDRGLWKASQEVESWPQHDLFTK